MAAFLFLSLGLQALPVGHKEKHLHPSSTSQINPAGFQQSRVYLGKSGNRVEAGMGWQEVSFQPFGPMVLGESFPRSIQPKRREMEGGIVPVSQEDKKMVSLGYRNLIVPSWLVPERDPELRIEKWMLIPLSIKNIPSQ